MKTAILGDCFRSAAKWIMDNAELLDARLAHGLVNGMGEAEGRRYGHAWVEIGDVVIDTESGWTGRREKYYELGQVGEVKLYDRETMLINLLKSEHWGPWEEDET